MKRMLQSGRVGSIIAFFAMAALPCLAGDAAVLRNGFSVSYERKQEMGLFTRLYVNPDGSSFVDVPTTEIDHIEAGPQDLAPRVKQQTPEVKSVAPPANLDELVASASGAYRLDPDLVNSVIRAESGFNVRAVSPKGARGLMQLMPPTASALGVEDAFDPRANVEGGTKYLRQLLERYNFDLVKALAAYNAGPQRVEQYGGVPPYYETKAYVARIVRDFNKKKLAAKNAAARNAGPAKNSGKSRAAAPAKSQSSVHEGASAASTTTAKN